MTAWGVTVTHVDDWLGETVSEKNLKQASAVIDIYTNRTEAASGEITARDLHYIRQAIAWQAVWLRDQPGFTARHTVVQQSADGVMVNAMDPGKGIREWTWNLAPMAARALKNLSWKANRGIDLSREKTSTALVTFLAEAEDHRHSWESM